MADEVKRWRTRPSCLISSKDKLLFPAVSLPDFKTYPVFSALYSFLRHLLHWLKGLSVSFLISGYNDGVVRATGAVGQSSVRKGDLGRKIPVQDCVHSFSSSDVLSNQDAGQVDSSLSFILIKQRLKWEC